MSEKICRWGILGTAQIARKNYQAILMAPNSTLAAVGSRTGQRAREFIDECQLTAPFTPPPRPAASYEALLNDPEIDAVYIPLPTGLRKEWILRAAQAGKHVLAEKPCGINAADVAEIVQVCAERNVQYMDGVMFMHGARLNRLREVLDDGTSVGQIRRINTQFSFPAPDDFFQGNIRVKSSLEPLGCLGDLGWYNLRIIHWTLQGLMPSQISARILHQQEGVPTEFCADLLYPHGISASFYCSFRTANQQWVNISGTHGCIHMDDFVLPCFGSETGFDVCNTDYTMRGCNFNMEGHKQRISIHEYSNSHPTAQEVRMIECFAANVLRGKPDPSWADLALKTQTLADLCLQSARDGKVITL